MDELERIRQRLEGIAEPLSLLAGISALAPVAIQIYAADGHCLLTNKAFRDLFGSEPPPEYNVLRDEIAEAQGVLGLIRRAFAGEVVQIPPVWYDPRDLKQVRVTTGRRVAFESTFFPLFDSQGRVSQVAIVFKDLTAEWLARAEVEGERDVLRAIIEQSGDGIIVADEQGVIRVVNAEAARQHGVEKQEVEARAWAQTYGLEAADGQPLPLRETPLYRALHGEALTGARWRVRRPDGSVRHLVGTATPLRRPDGSLAGAVLTTRDETERLRREEESERMARFWEQFTGILGHDLRTPLTAIKGSASLVLRGKELPPGLRRAVTRIADSADRMTRMICDLLDFTRSRVGGGLNFEPVPCDLQSIVAAVVGELAVAYPDRRIRLETRGDVTGRWDADRIAQLVANLVGNALQYGLADAPVDVSARDDGATVLLAIHNLGPPIPAEEQEALFDPFRRGRTATLQTRSSGGLGLGLFIVQQIAWAHGGHVDVRSTEAEGTTFTVRLPRQTQARSPEPDGPQLPV